MRIMLYTHNGRGLGHISRICAIANALKELSPKSTVMIVSGSQYGTTLVPDGVDYIKIPSYYAQELQEDDRIVSRPRQCMTLEELMFVRRSMLLSVARSFRPDALVVDHFPQGKRGELLDLIRCLESNTSFSLVLRGVIDSPDRTSHHLSPGMVDYIKRSYECVFCCTDPRVLRLDEQYPSLSPLSSLTRHTGYVVSKPLNQLISPDTIRRYLGLQTGQKLVLVNFGGGQDTLTLLHEAIRVKNSLDQSIHSKFVVIAGPYLETADFHRLLEIGNDTIVIRKFTPLFLDYLNACDLYIGAAGYNALAEIMMTQARAIVIPRHQVEREQYIHAQKIQELGYCRIVDRNNLDSDRLGTLALDQLDQALKPERPSVKLDGAMTIASAILQLGHDDR